MTDSDFYLPVFAEDIVLSDISAIAGKVLDFGCGLGKFANQLATKKFEVFGCDVDKKIVEVNKKYRSTIKYKWFSPTGNTGYPKNFFDAVCMMGVLEHVLDERQTLQEIHRILKPSGYLYIYVINKGLLGAFDSANLKFIFPALHKWLYTLLWGQKAYSELFVNRKEEHLFGDFTLGKNWHTHYSVQNIKSLTQGLFDVSKAWHYSLFLPLLLVLDALCIRIFKIRSPLLAKLIRADNNIDLGNYSYCLVARCQKT